jgi:hypothetical protein
LRAIGSSDILTEDLWTSTLGTSGTPAFTYDGYLTINLSGAGDISYTSDVVSAVPEPATYGLLSGAGMLLLGLRRQFCRKA